MTAPRAGIIGTGAMGGRMAARVHQAGDPIVGYDRDAERLAASGIPAAGSLVDLVLQVDVVLLSLPDSTIIEAVVLGDGGVLDHARTGQVVVDLSTASPESTRRIHRALGEKGVEFLDAGISGGAKAADAGTLTIMVGGDAEALGRVRPVLDRFAAKIFHMGESGAGHTAKLLNNFLNGIALAATAEVMVAAKRSGLDLEQFLDVLNSSTGVNFATLNRFPHIVKGDYLEGGLTGGLMAKDLRLYLEHVARIGVPTFTGPACLAAFEVANALGYEDQISNRVVDGIGDLAGGVRLQDPVGTRTRSREGR
ncbi:MAG: NAD(P)-dependent oxidoreductase [Solirubrobacterales bacterium]|nr:NAD(P)-dependent oxidoreductase [Solirubrobacterales bacterium]MBV9714031.1 NAD(P)-dependent oxidoreductase [Solirubrobacterales bacterium]